MNDPKTDKTRKGALQLEKLTVQDFNIVNLRKIRKPANVIHIFIFTGAVKIHMLSKIYEILSKLVKICLISNITFGTFQRNVNYEKYLRFNDFQWKYSIIQLLQALWDSMLLLKIKTNSPRSDKKHSNPMYAIIVNEPLKD